jgi:hypothetical protein
VNPERYFFRRFGKGPASTTSEKLVSVRLLLVLNNPTPSEVSLSPGLKDEDVNGEQDTQNRYESNTL